MPSKDSISFFRPRYKIAIQFLMNISRRERKKKKWKNKGGGRRGEREWKNFVVGPQVFREIEFLSFLYFFSFFFLYYLFSATDWTNEGRAGRGGGRGKVGEKTRRAKTPSSPLPLVPPASNRFFLKEKAEKSLGTSTKGEGRKGGVPRSFFSWFSFFLLFLL